LEAGEYSVHWEGRNHEDEPAAAGIYFARLTVETRAETEAVSKEIKTPSHKIILIR
jgi:hypothetical protein